MFAITSLLNSAIMKIKSCTLFQHRAADCQTIIRCPVTKSSTPSLFPTLFKCLVKIGIGKARVLPQQPTTVRVFSASLRVATENADCFCIGLCIDSACFLWEIFANGSAIQQRSVQLYHCFCF